MTASTKPRRGLGLAVLIAFVVGCIGSAALWRYWTPLCNETCPAWRVASMWGFVAAWPIICVLAVLAARPMGMGGRLALGVVLVVVLGGVVVWLS